MLVALSAGEAGQKPFSKIVLQNVEVLAVAQEIEQQKDQPQVVKVVTLVVKPEEAEWLALAGHEGVLRLAMRNYNDRDIVLTAGADLNQLVSSYSAAVPPAPRRAKVAARLQPVRVEIERDGKAAQPADFVQSAALPTAAPAGQWLPVSDDAPPAGAQWPQALACDSSLPPRGRQAKACPHPSGPSKPQGSQAASSAVGLGAGTTVASAPKTTEVNQ